MKTSSFAYVEMRLIRWATWFSRNNLYGIGFPSSSMQYRIMVEGIVIRSTAPKQFPSNEDAEETEALVKEIEKENKKVGLALRGQYFGNKTSRERAEQLGIPYSVFRSYVVMGKHWLAGRLSAQR